MLQMRKKLTRAVLLTGVVLTASVVTATEKITYVNMQTVFEKYYKTIRAQASFTRKKLEFKDRVELKREELRRLDQDCAALKRESDDELRDASARKESRRKLGVRVAALRKRSGEFEQFRTSEFRELRQQQEAFEQRLIGEITEYVREWCKANGHEMVLDIAGKSFNRMPVVLLYPKDLEVTKEIVDAINRGHEAELKTAREELKELESSLPGADSKKQGATGGEPAGGK
ncbi:MAG: OmpH family outer membrane protein [Lentisphaeria bacterium]|nr:OmpH family outer membrane protein [Lentisphaeria bacterium]